MILFYGMILILAILGMTLFSSSPVLCILTALAAAGGCVCELLLSGKWRKLSGLLLALCLGLCFLTGQSGAASAAQDYEAAMQKVIDQVDDGKLDAAKAQLEELEESCGVTDASRYAWVYLYANLENYEKARDYMNQAEDTHSLEWYARMEELYIREGTPEAMEALAKLYPEAAENLPESAHMQLMAGLTQMDSGRIASAQYYLQRAASLDETDPQAPY